MGGKMHNEGTKETAVEANCSTDKETEAASAAATLAPPHASPSSSAAPKHNIQRGLSTKVALSRLHEEIQSVLLDQEREYAAERCFCKLRAAFMKRYDSPLGWLSIGTTLLTSAALLTTGMYWPAICLLVILTLDLYVVIRESNLRRTEIYRKTRHALSEIRLAEQHLSDNWHASNYPHLSNPMSPCVSLQWTYRDGQIVNLPWALLVRGDCIVLRPGHISPGPCHEVQTKRFFNTSEIYGVSTAQLGDPPVKPMARAPLPDLVCCLERTPYLDNLRLCLKNSLKRPPTIYNQQRYLLVTKYIQQWGFMSALIITLFAGLLRLHGYGLPTDEKHNWRHVLIGSPAAAVIPLLPLVFPLLWISMNLWGVARLQCFLKTPQAVLEKGMSKSFEDLDLDAPGYDYDSISLLRSNVLRIWTQLWQGDSELLPRSANLVQVLGSISALCCVDKKGILSWPNPTAEKVFFLHNTEEEPHDDDGSQMSMTTESDNDVNDVENKERGIVAEVLDLTHDQHCPFRLEFDDHEWKAHIKSLKPLGLAILLNTCSPLTHEHYAQFCGHVSAVAMLDKDLVPVTNRYAMFESSMKCLLHGRCLCELAKQIGFTNHATDRFALEGQLASYRHLQPDVVRRDIRFARQLQLSTKVKVPFPHSLSVVMRENPGGYLSLFTQGTADIILDCCDDFWDGKDLRPLSPQDRKRALDFYQRSALTSYCTAFAYRPLRHGIHGALSGPLHSNGQIAYLELPPESKLRMQHVDKSHCDFEAVGHHVKLSHSISTDSLLFSENKDEDCNDVEGCFEMQCHQVFIGMVTMQYQAQNDIVHLVERLERACIRFVHFSKENELRSRVFSEKMGLESGWNCHISLLSEPEPEREKSLTGKTKETTAGNNTTNIATTTTTTNNNTSTIIDVIHPSSDQVMSDASTDLVGADPPDGPKLSYLLSPPNNLESSKTLSCSAPGAISNPEECELANAQDDELAEQDDNELDTTERHKQRHSLDSAMDENCRSLSTLTESTDQSAPINFDMSNRAKLPRGIENIRPHLEQVDNVPLQVSLFTDCSAEATRQMLDIMQSYGEIVVCLGSSASNDNANIFLQADCSIAVEPLYPQVCQDVDAYTESNLQHNKLHYQHGQTDSLASEQLLESGTGARSMQSPAHTVSPIYLSRLLNSLPCSIAICRDDPLSLVAIIELSRRFSLGLWNCIQFWACCAGSISILNVFCACLSLPPLLTPLLGIYLMCVPVPLIAISLAHIDLDPKIMNRATSKKQTEYDSRAFAFVMWCYGCKFLVPVVAVLIAYWMCMTQSLSGRDDKVNNSAELELDIEDLDDDDDDFYQCLYIARSCALFAVLLHFALVSVSFVHRDHALWQRNPFRNRIWAFTCLALLLLHGFICGLQMLLDDSLDQILPQLWLPILLLFASSILSLLISELAKFQENKVNTRYQRRARLDFGTKLGMNSPF